MSSTEGTASDLPVKEKYMRDLTDEDIYTYVTLKDCELPVRKGSLTPINEGYANAGGAHRCAKYATLMRDINGNSMYIYTNTTCLFAVTVLVCLIVQVTCPVLSYMSFSLVSNT